MEQKENISSSSSSTGKNTRDEREISSASTKRRKNISKIVPAEEKISLKFLNFKPNAFHQKAVEFLRYLPEIDSISDIIREHSSRGYEELATLFRQQPELNFAFVTEQFAAEVWSLFLLEREKQDGDEEVQTEKIEAVATTSPSPATEKRDQKTAQKQSGGTGSGEAENRVNKPGKRSEYALPFNQAASEVEQAVGEAQTPSKQASADQKGGGQSEEQSHQESPETPVTNPEVVNPQQENREPNLATNVEQNTEELHIPDVAISEIIVANKGTTKEPNGENISEIVPAEENLSLKFEGNTDQKEKISPTNNKISPSSSGIVKKNQKGDRDTNKLSSRASRKTSAHGPHTLEIAEVAEKFETTIAVIEEAIQNNQLKLSKRGENKILVSSLKDFSPPRKRGRRPTKKLVEAEAEAEAVS